MKYKLIKEYPGSLELGSTVDNLGDDWMENYSEFWQPVVEKDYEILFYITIESELIKYEDLNINDDLNCDKYLKIHSVKRLSDGEIFTVGDKINNKCYNHSLDKIILWDNKILLQHNFSTWTLSHSLENVTKPKQPVFQTEDGVDIFEGDNIYWVNINTFEKVNCNKFNDDLGEISIKSLLSKKYECKAVGFSTKEKAEEYILMNKPCLSINDIKNTFPRIFDGEKELIKIVKSKI